MINRHVGGHYHLMSDIFENSPGETVSPLLPSPAAESVIRELGPMSPIWSTTWCPRRRRRYGRGRAADVDAQAAVRRAVRGWQRAFVYRHRLHGRGLAIDMTGFRKSGLTWTSRLAFATSRGSWLRAGDPTITTARPGEPG